MATRGHLGGLSLATPEAVRLLDAVGRRWILVETVGVGQVEVEMAGKADTTVVVVNPGWGDGVQANKAGLMEIADVFVINKADRDGVEETRRIWSRCSTCPIFRTTPGVRRSCRPSRRRGEGGRCGKRCSTTEATPRSGQLAGRRSVRLREELREIVAPAGGRAPVGSGAGERWDELTEAGRRPAPSIRGPPPTTLLGASTADPERRDRTDGPGDGRRSRCWSGLERRDDGVTVITLANRRSTHCRRAARRARGGGEDLIADPPGAVVITGGERIFAAGADISEFGGPARRRTSRPASTVHSTRSPRSHGS